MEGLGAPFFSGWKIAAKNLLWARDNLRKPAFSALDAWFSKPLLGRNNYSEMRFATVLSLTHSDGFILYGDPNPLPAMDHLHDWYPFWDKSPGKPAAPMSTRTNGLILREFEHGFAVLNPPENEVQNIEFGTMLKRASTGTQDRRFSVAPGDGEIFLKP